MEQAFRISRQKDGSHLSRFERGRKDTERFVLSGLRPLRTTSVRTSIPTHSKTKAWHDIRSSSGRQIPISSGKGISGLH
jgi:hypothetical protein